MADNNETMKLHILLEEEEKINLIGLLFPDNTEPVGLVWLSDNEETATVTAAGVVTGVKPGTAKITVRNADSSMEDSVMVLVMGKEDTGLRLSILLKPAEKCRLVAMFGEAKGAAVWTSGDETVATVDQNGRVTAVAVGTTLITVTSEDGSMTDQVYVTVRDEGPAPEPTGVYGIRIDKNQPDPDKRVTYLCDAVGKRPARMNYESGVFDYGDWADVWFVKENKPCMLKYDGTVDYYLDPDDYSKKEDGTASDVANVDYEGNAMAEFPLIWMKQYEEGQYEYILVSDHQVDEEYTAYPYTREDGSIADKLYLRMFEGSFDGRRIRSISKQPIMLEKTAEEQIFGAESNGPSWTINSWCEWDMLSTLLLIISKNTDSQRSFGSGNTISSPLSTGSLEMKGQFTGFSDSSHAVRVFYLENWWGNLWNRIHGVTLINGRIHVKMALPYNNLGEGYEDCGLVSKCPNAFLSRLCVGRLGKIPFESNGSESTFYCDGGYILSGSSNKNSAVVGGNTGAGSLCGALAIGINIPDNVMRQAYVACLSARPPKPE